MSRAKSLLNDTVVLAFGTLGGRVLGILLLPLYTRALTRAEFGTVDLVITSVDLVLPLLFLSVSEAVLRFAMTRGEHPGDIVRTALMFVAGGWVLVVIAAGVATLWWPWLYVVLVASIIAVQAVTLVLGAWGRAVGRVRTYAVSGLAQAAGIGIANVVFLLGMGLGVAGFLLSLLIGNVAAIGVLLGRLPVLAAVRAGSFDRSLLLRMLAFSAPLVPNVVLWWLTNISGRYFLAFTDGIEQVGLFGVATRFPVLVTMVTTVFAQAWQLSANRYADDDRRGKFYSDVFRFYAAALILSVASLVIVLKPLMRVIAPPAYFEAWEAVPPLLAGAMFAGFASFYGAIYTAARRSTGVFRTTLVAGVTSVALNTLLIPAFGLMGAAFSIALCFLGLWVLRVADSQSITPTTVSARVVVPALLLLALQSAVQYIPVDDAWAYSLMTTAWLGLVWLFRREVRQTIARLVHAASHTRARS